jgi:hypothetical protein
METSKKPRSGISKDSTNPLAMRTDASSVKVGKITHIHSRCIGRDPEKG